MASIKLKGDTSGEVIISAPSVAGNTYIRATSYNWHISNNMKAIYG